MTRKSQLSWKSKRTIRNKELFDQAGGYAYSKNPEENSYGRPLNEEKYTNDKYTKFAELIIMECIEACQKHTDIESFGILPVRAAMVTNACASNIKKHFGVE